MLCGCLLGLASPAVGQSDPYSDEVTVRQDVARLEFATIPHYIQNISDAHPQWTMFSDYVTYAAVRPSPPPSHYAFACRS